MFDWLKNILSSIGKFVGKLIFSTIFSELKIDIARLEKKVSDLEKKTIFEKPVEDSFEAFCVRWIKFNGNQYYNPYCPVDDTLLKKMEKTELNSFSSLATHIIKIIFKCQRCKCISEQLTEKQYKDCIEGKVDR